MNSNWSCGCGPCWREGIVPLLQMHDCLDCSVASQEQGELVARLGGEAVSLAVPMRVDLKFGRSWGDAKHTWDGTVTGEAQQHRRAGTGEACRAGEADQRAGEAQQRHRACTAEADQHRAEAQSRHGEADCASETLRHRDHACGAPAISDADGEMQIDLADLIDEPVPRNRKVLCRFHDEAHADACTSIPIIFIASAAARYGDHVDWLMRVEGLDPTSRWICSKTGTDQSFHGTPVRDDDAERTARALELWDAAEANRRNAGGALSRRTFAASISTHCRPTSTTCCASIGTVRSAQALGIPACSR